MGDRIALARAVTIVESKRTSDRETANKLISQLLPYTGNSIRIGITGVPGAGKSTFIEAFGTYLTSIGKKIAVLTIDPSSAVTGGSILGDKTRMPELSRNPNAFIRTSPAGDALGGIAHHTRESVLLCEAAGYDVVVVETVGVGQSEAQVKDIVDFFMLLMLAGAGDELQGIKKGIFEQADAVLITKADGENELKAREAQSEYQQALHYQLARTSGWTPRVISTSSVTGKGIPEAWDMIELYKSKTQGSGFFSHNRNQQQVQWFREQFRYLLEKELRSLKTQQQELEGQIIQNQITPGQAAEQLLASYHKLIQE